MVSIGLNFLHFAPVIYIYTRNHLSNSISLPLLAVYHLIFYIAMIIGALLYRIYRKTNLKYKIMLGLNLSTTITYFILPDLINSELNRSITDSAIIHFIVHL
jgi:hypothetical protein